MIQRTGCTATAMLCLLVAVTSSASAQTLGAKAGVAWSSVAFEDGPEPSDARAATGVLAGGFVGLPLARRLGLQADVLFVERRTEFADAPGSEATFTDTLRYLEIPVVFRYRLLGWGSAHVVLEGGGTFATRLSARETSGGGDSDISEAIEPREVSAVAGAAVDWRRWIVGVRYAFGVSDVYTAPEFLARQRTLQVSVGFRVR